MQMLTQQDLEQMLRNLENMARSGNRDMAEQMLSELRDLLDRLQSGRMADQGQSQRFGKMMDEFGDIIGKQQQAARRHLRPAAGRAQRGQKGSRPARPEGPARAAGSARPRAQGEGEDGDQDGGLSDRQRELRERLGRLQRGLQEFGPAAARAAEGRRRLDGSRRAGAARRRPCRGADQETRALEQLRQGAREMAQQMLRQMPSRFGLNGNQGELDPMGRPPQRTDGPDPGTGGEVPDEIDVQRAREILEELRRRLGETTRPPIELEYLERLLKRF